MKIQSLSVCVPGDSCINNCRSCVSRMNEKHKQYKNQLEENIAFYDLYLNDFMKRLQFCRDNGCNTLMLTGAIEPQQNMNFLRDFGIMMKLMKNPFPIIEIQTTGVTIDTHKLRFLRNHVGVSTISLSLFSFKDNENQNCRGSTLPLNIKEFCKQVKLYDFNLRLSLNLTSHFDKYSAHGMINECKDLGADQILFRRLHDSDDDSEQSKWVKENRMKEEYELELKDFLSQQKILRRLEHGPAVRSVKGISTVYDLDSMAVEEKTGDEVKYLIIRPNGKLYSSWDDPASLIF